VVLAVDSHCWGLSPQLYADLVPKTAENFRALTTGEKGPDFSFKNSVCHRILTGFIVQCGDYTTGKGYGGRSIYGAKFGVAWLTALVPCLHSADGLCCLCINALLQTTSRTGSG
jgi:hypothetical protein